MKLAWSSVLLCLAACATAPVDGVERKTPRVELEFRGNASFSDGKLASQVALDLEHIERRTSPKSSIDDAAYSLVEFYRSQGFPDCQVDYSVADAPDARLAASFRISEGPRTALVDVDVLGARFFRRSQLLEELGFDDLDSVLGPHWFVERELDSARAALASAYSAEGFVDVRVEPPEFVFDDDRRAARVRLRVDEGARVLIGEVGFAAGLDPELVREFDVRPFRGRPASPRQLFDLRESVEELYGQRGYPEAEVELVELGRDASARAALEIRARPGPRVTIREVRVTGNAKTARSQIVQRLALAAGDRYDVRKLRESFRALNRSGLFRRVRIELEPGGEEQRALLVELDEATSTEIFAEPGYGSYEGARLLGGVRENNLFGSTRAATLEGLIAERASRITAAITEPRVFGSEFEAGLALFQELREEPSFDKSERGASLTLARDLERRLRIGVEYRFRRSEVSDVAAAAAVPDATADVDISSIGASLTWDERDSIFEPRSGNLLRCGAEFADRALGSQLDYLRLRVSDSAFFPLGSRSVVGLAWRTGVIVPLEGTDVIPIQERFFNGGENSVRSFAENELGPKDASGEPLGGEAFHALSLELRRTLWGALDGALFYDAGTLVERADDLFVFDDTRHALGAGLRYQMPIGPIRVDWGWNPQPRADEDTWALHFSVGMSF